MPKSVSVGLCLIGSYAALSAYGRGGTAVSAEANTARRAADALAKSVERSQALFGQKAAALSRLQEIANESSEENWDGYGARAVGRGAVLNAQDFIRSLPEMIPIPELAPEPDGAVSLDWIQSRYRLFSVSVGASRRLAYAWLDGADRGHGVARFDGERIPARVLEGIRSIINHGNAALRSF